MSTPVKNIFRLCLFILIQVYLLNSIPHLHRYIVPYLYFLFILWLPFNTNRLVLLIAGFITGLLLDYFSNTPGLHAAACVLIAYIRPFIISILIPKDISELNYQEPSRRSLGWAPYLVYVFILATLHNAYLLFLEFLHFGTFLDFIIKLFSTTAISLLLIFTTELLFPRKAKYRGQIVSG